MSLGLTTDQAEAAAQRFGPRVLFVIPGENSGGSMIFARRQADSLRALGVEVDCFFLRSRTSPLILFEEWRRICRVLRASRPSVIHAHFGTVTALFAILASPLTPLIVTFRGTDLNPFRGGGVRAAAGRLFSQIAALKAARIVCVSRQLRGRLWWQRSRVTVLASGVDSVQFRPFDRSEARRILGWTAREPVVLFNAGYDARNKRLDLAEAAFRRAQRVLPELRLEILRGDTDPALLPVLMNASDCLLVTSDSEGSPTVVQEALACALPVVSVPVGDIEERLCGVEPSRIVARDADLLGAALAELTGTPRRSNGPSKIRDFSLPSIAAELKGLYQALAEARSS